MCLRNVCFSVYETFFYQIFVRLKYLYYHCIMNIIVFVKCRFIE